MQQKEKMSPFKFMVFSKVDSDTMKEIAEFAESRPKIVSLCNKLMSDGLTFCLNKMVNPKQLAKETADGKGIEFWQAEYGVYTRLAQIFENAKDEHKHRLAYRAANESPDS